MNSVPDEQNHLRMNSIPDRLVAKMNSDALNNIPDRLVAKMNSDARMNNIFVQWQSDLARTLGVGWLKLENFNGSNFNAWRRKGIFGMQLLKIYYVVSEEKPNFEEDSKSEASLAKDDHLCRSYLLNCLADHLADTYTNKPSTKEIWNALEEQYKDKEKLSKSHVIDKFLGFKFEDDTEILPQVKELEMLVMKPKDEMINLCQTFIFGAIVNKLHPSYTCDFKSFVTGGGMKYFITFIDDHSHIRYIYLLKSKDEAFSKFVGFRT
ncbi:uncharacterized protein LOC109847071 [Asparagus officinalis]|uniref:uncharacterized protein LOC109847071 n=1 Tax=Asparagus officinalis TaxID=4686 RepID=UPI00098E6EDF|nr:uncharacterized protein LOC109847071 [Asparagus officinalis]